MPGLHFICSCCALLTQLSAGDLTDLVRWQQELADNLEVLAFKWVHVCTFSHYDAKVIAKQAVQCRHNFNMLVVSVEALSRTCTGINMAIEGISGSERLHCEATMRKLPALVLMPQQKGYDHPEITGESNENRAC